MNSFDQVTENYTVRNRKKLLKFCSPLFDALPINNFFFQFINKDGRFSFFSTQPDLAFDYFSGNMYLDNPFIMNSEGIKQGMYLIDSLKDPKFQNDINHIHEKYKSKHLISLTRKNSGYTYEYGFGSDLHQQVTPMLVNQTVLLKNFIDYFHLEFSDVVKSMHENSISIKNEIAKQERFKINLPNISLSEMDKFKFYAQLGMFKEFSEMNIKLTSREIEILSLYFKGQSARLVAKTLHLSSRTIENHLENIKQKFQCTTKSELFVRLNQMQKIDLYPQIFI